MARRHSILLYLLVLLLTGTPSLAQQGQTLEVLVERTIIHVDETLGLTIKLSGPNPGVSLDLSVLEKDFAIVGTSQNLQSTIIDGQTTLLSEWIITLAPKRLGQLVIPSFSVGNHNSQPIRITVLSPEQAGLGAIIFQAKPQMAIGQWRLDSVIHT
ncbi:MAG: BatD family protein [Nitrospira sp.]|nr:BatD family protein [Nitrospira sp.]